MRLVDRNGVLPCFREAPWAVGQASSADEWQPLGECWSFQNLEMPCFDGRSSDCSAEHIFPVLCFLT